MQQTFVPYYVILLAYTLCYMPTLGLVNALSFHHIADPSKDFPRIRVLGHHRLDRGRAHHRPSRASSRRSCRCRWPPWRRR